MSNIFGHTQLSNPDFSYHSIWAKTLNEFNNLFILTGKRALITGSTQGIGNTLARGLAIADAEFIINSRHQDRVDHDRKQLIELGYIAHGLSSDVTSVMRSILLSMILKKILALLIFWLIMRAFNASSYIKETLYVDEEMTACVY